MPEWLKNELGRFNINHRFETEGFFETINRDDSDINILMGSRSFYEGWDSNRPNILLFVNIGVGSDAKKFVLQSVGRGVRIEPQKNMRKRLQNLLNAKIVKEQLFEKVKNLILPIESLFVFGTNAENLKKIIATLKAEKQDKNLGDVFIVNPEREGKILLIPGYRSLVLRPVITDDFMTASPAIVGQDISKKALSELVKQLAKQPKIAAVMLDLTSKPPGTIEWE